MADLRHRFLNPMRLALLGLSAALAMPAVAASGDTEQRIRDSLAAAVPGLEVRSVEATEVGDFYQVKTNQDMIYVSGDGQHVLLGNLLRLDADEGVINLTERARADERKAAIDEIPEESMIRFIPDGEVKAEIYVFTDIDCGYCRRMHAAMPGYHALGIQVNYLAFPRAGQGSSGHTKAVSAWCADDPNEAMDLAKAGKPIPEKTCSNPVDEQHRLGQALGVSGTPAILLEDGRLVPGFRPPQAMAEVLGLN